MSVPHQSAEAAGDPSTMITGNYDAGRADESNTDEDTTVGVDAVRRSRRTKSSGYCDMPEELLVEIFLMVYRTFPTFQDCTWDASAPGLSFAQWEKDTLSFLHAICGVCWSWRETAKSTCELWSRISLARMSAPTYDLVCERLMAFVERSAARPLELCIAQRDEKEDEADPQPLQRLWESAGRILLDQADRCTSFHYYSAYQSPTTLLPLPGRLENLTEFNVHISSATPNLCILGPANAAPLQKVKISVLVGSVSSIFDHIHGEAISDLVLHLPKSNGIPVTGHFHVVDAPGRRQWDMVAAFISRCPNTMRLAVDYRRGPETELPPSTLPQLSHLSLSDNLSAGLGKFILAPVLTHLTLLCKDLSASVIHQDYPASFPSLESLEIEAVPGVYSNLSKLHRVIRRQPNLRTLTLSYIEHGDVILIVRLLLNDVFRPWMALRGGQAPQDWEGPFVPELSCVRFLSISLPHVIPRQDELSAEISKLMERRPQLRFEFDPTVFEVFARGLEERWGDRISQTPRRSKQSPRDTRLQP